MGILDLFKKKAKSTFPENELEQCLIDAESDVNARKDFYQKLLWNQLYVLTGDSANAEGNDTNEMYTTNKQNF